MNSEKIYYDKRNYIKPTEDNWQEVLFELTSYCNLNCPFCLNESSAENKEYMTFDNFKIMVDRIKNKVKLLQLSGGEPLANPYIFEMVDYLIENRVTFHINTNGMLLTEKMIEKIANYPRASIQFSLDGVNAETDDSLRCKGHFERIVSIMRLFHERGFRKGVVKMVINRLNYCQIKDYFNLAMEYGFLPTYAFLVKSGRAHNIWDELNIDDKLKFSAREEIRELLDRHSDYIRGFGTESTMFYLKNMNIDYVGECHFNLGHYNFSPTIHADGSAQPCEGLFQKEFCIGNLLYESPDEIYTHGNKLVREFAEEVRKRRQRLDNELCKDCILNSTCGKGCIAESYNAGDFYGKPADCGMRKRDFMYNALNKEIMY
ncbi:MAG: radical SAM protein [Lachnospiraceae bacterium]|nr:radical SAM protein [Lachnospiraceae bacterium]